MSTVEVVAAVIVRDGKVFAAQRGYGDYKGWWEFPGGKIESGESHADALCRELEEELRIRVEVGDVLCTVEYDYPNFHLIMHCYCCRLLDDFPQLTEHLSACWVDKTQLDSLKWLPADIEVIEKLKSRLA